LILFILRKLHYYRIFLNTSVEENDTENTYYK